MSIKFHGPFGILKNLYGFIKREIVSSDSDFGCSFKLLILISM